ncbi:MAG: Trm112 family protein [Planctomycetes bacterium]|nr:Trm112 family protein [Planctomycetota bacterium]MCB9888821.1 Trm112 family protein [Planctomycetota bacterium]
MDPEYLSILMCPKTRGALRLATPAELQRANAAAARDGQPGEPLEAGLVCESGTLMYPIRDGIPILLIDEAIELGSAGDA